MFDRLVHADWSVAAPGRWCAEAERGSGRWHVDAVGLPAAMLDAAFTAADGGTRVLLGFDFPIGVPEAYGARTGCADFRALLHAVGAERWQHFFDAAQDADEIAVERPFYPARSSKGVTRTALVAGLGVGDFRDLLRACERRTADRREASSLFWTLGGAQVGKAAASGWRAVIRPALEGGARLWPFDGALPALAAEPGVVLAETYPAEAYRMVGAGFTRDESKRRQNDRCGKADAILAWADRHSVRLTDRAHETVRDGFGADRRGEDRFDAFLGLLKMIEVADGRCEARTEDDPAALRWEGWILGR